MINFFVSAICGILILIFGFLNQFWVGFSYFALFLSIGICVYWLVIIILSYIENFIKNIDERYKLYCAELINSTNLSSADIMANKDLYFQQFKRSLRKEKIYEILKGIVVLAILISCVGLFFSGTLF